MVFGLIYSLIFRLILSCHFGFQLGVLHYSFHIFISRTSFHIFISRTSFHIFISYIHFTYFISHIHFTYFISHIHFTHFISCTSFRIHFFFCFPITVFKDFLMAAAELNNIQMIFVGKRLDIFLHIFCIMEAGLQIGCLFIS